MPPEARPADTGLAWGVRRSFVGYVQAAGGSIAVDPPAGMTAAGEFHFPLDIAPAAGGGEAATLRFAGRVRFLAHGGLLRVDLVDPWLTVGEECTLSVEAAPGRRLPVVVVDLPPRRQDALISMWLDAETRLHPDAVELFGGSYDADARFEPLTLRVPTTRYLESLR